MKRVAIYFWHGNCPKSTDVDRQKNKMVSPVGCRTLLKKLKAMIELLVMNRFNKLLQQYLRLKEEAKSLLANGHLDAYAPKLIELQRVKAQLNEAATSDLH